MQMNDYTPEKTRVNEGHLQFVDFQNKVEIIEKMMHNVYTTLILMTIQSK